MLPCTSVETTGGTRLVTFKMDALAAPYGCNDVIFVVTACEKTSQYGVNFQRHLDSDIHGFFSSL